MERTYQEYKDIAAIYIVYISEAHAMDDRSPVGYAEKLGIKEHTTYGERCTVATRLVSEKKLTIPCLIDNMDNAAAKAYSGWPDRVYLIDKDGKLAVAGNRGPWGFPPALGAAEKWLAEYKKTGVEPPAVVLKDEMAEYREVSRRMSQAYQKGDYAAALAYAEESHRLQPKDVSAMYNVACFHCLVGHKEQAYSWIEKAIDAGYDDADHLTRDDDLKSIRDEDRFKELVERLRQ